MEAEEKGSEIILGALLTLDPHHFSTFTRFLVSDARFLRRRLSALLLSPSHFHRTLSHIESRSLSDKTLLLASLLLRFLRPIAHFLSPDSNPLPAAASEQDLDAGLLLLTLCAFSDSERRSLSANSDWMMATTDHVAREALTVSGIGAGDWAMVGVYVDAAMKCRRLVDAVGTEGRGEAAATSLVAVRRPRGRECVICKEELGVGGGRQACELPCSHAFHRGCIARWLRRVNLCPCCRRRLPADDVFGEIERLWNVIAAKSGLSPGLLKREC